MSAALFPLALNGCGVVGLEPIELDEDAALDATFPLEDGDESSASGEGSEPSMGEVGARPGSGGSGGRPQPSGGSSSGGAANSGGSASGGADAAGGMSASGGMPSAGGTPATGGLPGCSPNCEVDDDDVISFETFDEEPAGETYSSGGGQVVYTEDFGYLDGTAMCGTQGEATSEAEVRETIPVQDDTEFHFRSWVYIPVGALNGRIKLLGLNHSSGGVLDFNALAGGAGQVYISETGADDESPTGFIPEGEWFCLQASTHIDRSEGWMEMAINGEVIAELHDEDTRPRRASTLLSMGSLIPTRARATGKFAWMML